MTSVPSISATSLGPLPHTDFSYRFERNDEGKPCPKTEGRALFLLGTEVPRAGPFCQLHLLSHCTSGMGSWGPEGLNCCERYREGGLSMLQAEPKGQVKGWPELGESQALGEAPGPGCRGRPPPHVLSGIPGTAPPERRKEVQIPDWELGQGDPCPTPGTQPENTGLPGATVQPALSAFHWCWGAVQGTTEEGRPCPARLRSFHSD